MIPSVEDAAVIEPLAKATKVLLPKAADCQPTIDGSVRNVHVMPSVEDAAVVELYPKATKVLTGLL